MNSKALTPSEYMTQLPEDRKDVVQKLRQTILDHIDSKFQECMNYGMLGYVVPFTIYPDGYHCNPKLPLPFMNLASQKNFIAVYHMGMYAKKEIYDWFVTEYPKHTTAKLDMGKSCIRFKKMDAIPYALIGQLAAKLSVEEWIAIYESQIKKF
ncbi:MAG: DUF1801 domain-containing protein [Flavobacteriaceae bacterium]|jgi:hypothetical protein|nr:DUF1801 domain-containing protein [Flavobacteriaceae bacterium]